MQLTTSLRFGVGHFERVRHVAAVVGARCLSITGGHMLQREGVLDHMQRARQEGNGRSETYTHTQATNDLCAARKAFRLPNKALFNRKLRYMLLAFRKHCKARLQTVVAKDRHSAYDEQTRAHSATGGKV